MWKIWPNSVAILALCSPLPLLADGVNNGLQDNQVVPIVRANPTNGAPLTAGSNAVGRPGVGPDQIYGYDVNIAYDHVAVAAAIVAVLFLMTEWMEAR